MLIIEVVILNATIMAASIQIMGNKTSWVAAAFPGNKENPIDNEDD